MDITIKVLDDMIKEIPVGYDVSNWVFSMSPTDYNTLTIAEPKKFKGFDIELFNFIESGKVYLGHSIYSN